ncbi:GNAT family N-acetyltransferase [Actinomadura harenae]|uniref:GNAT family N-acetyltransferase n=1 Tax=Actinomadura harenae TaxID=2483351 RepID=A0A3M2MC95_9ACTN|nr:GNAT family N-acetyltransferase [Actinomadura harenae]RMI46523.1 GNAT family N-acetyltransferase [Actinomadura harenae]
MTDIEVGDVPWNDPDASALRAALQSELDERYGDIPLPPGADVGDLVEAMTVHPERVAWVGVARVAGVAAGHVALCHGDDEPELTGMPTETTRVSLELKRMYVAPVFRGTGVARVLLDAAEDAARARGVARIVLQTGPRQPDAVRMYEREGYSHIPLLPAYRKLTFSICMAKDLPCPSG